MFNVLVVEDDKNLKKLMVTYLKKNNYTTFEARNGIQALDIIDKQYIDLVISDIMMPEMDGYELLNELRIANYEIPIMLITAKSDISDKKQGFILGADDYMVKPIDMEEMVLRVSVLLKRAKSANKRKIILRDLIIDYDQLSVVKHDKVYNLAQKEFYLLYKLVSTPNTIFTRQELIEEIWGLESESEYRTVDVHIKRLREKLKELNELEIVTVRGLGYKCIINKEKVEK
ncbi:response regulator receiver domain protein [Clostridium sp. CAG:356]|nr:MAG: DNA-binding response regulator [Clostridium sp. 28_12]CDD36756.1 response regulator receiver domain protein [Clostridium sp. CAG:356]